MTEELELTEEQKNEITKAKELKDSLKEFGVSAVEVVNEHGRGLLSPTIMDKNTAIIADYSGSMDERTKNGEAAYEIVTRTLYDYQGYKTFYMYNSEITTTRPNCADGSTPLHRALDRVIREGYKNVVIITDGIPDNEDACKPYAEQLCINTVFIGRDGDTYAIDFLKKLVGWSNGQFTTLNLNTELLSDGLNKLLISQDSAVKDDSDKTIQL